MIDPKELRIGNLITSAARPSLNFCVSALDILHLSENQHDAKGIPITPEILTEWCGFEYKRTEKSDTYRLGNFRANYTTEGRFKGKRFMVFGNVLTFEDFSGCQYLHQFQNLVFALTGTELQIKIPVKA